MTIVSAVPFNLQNGTTADATQVMADFNSIKNDVNTNAAHNGANNDITSLAGLTTPLSVAQGGTGTTTAAASFGIQGYLFGCGLSNHSGGTTAIDVASGVARDSTNADNMILASALTGKVLANAWSVGNNGGFLDTGSVANTTYFIYLIKRVDTGVVDAIASTSASAPTLPTNYTLYRRIGSIIRATGAIVLFSQLGDEFLLNTMTVDINSANPGTSAVSATMTSLPVGIQVEGLFYFTLQDTSPGSTTSLLISSLDTADVAPVVTTTGVGQTQALTSTTSRAQGYVRTRTNTSAQIRYRLSQSNAAITVVIVSLGWIDTRGRLY